MSNVYFTNMRTKSRGIPVTEKLKRLMKAAGFDQIDLKGKYVAIKMHFGELGNIAFLRPNFARAVAEVVKEFGGRPYLCDCNTLYVGSRHNGLDHLDVAQLNGFNYLSAGCHVVIGDGIKGTDEVLVPVKGGEVVKTAYIGKGIYDADVIVSLAHFKGHEGAGFGGAIKNLGMGSASIAGKKDQHSSGQPQVTDGCIGCQLCASQCAYDAIRFVDDLAQIDHSKCVGCGSCVGTCPQKVIEYVNGNAEEILNKKMAEYTKAVVDGKTVFNINVIMDVSPNCDCHGENDTPIIPDVGMLCSFDPVAIDVASAELCNKQKPNHLGALGCSCHHHEHFDAVHPNTNWRVQATHGEKIGLGSTKYNLIELDLR